MSGHIYVTGFMGAGKTSVGRAYAERVGRPFVDLDALIEEQQGETISELWDRSGEAAFRVIEAKCFRAVAELDGGRVVACGGGTLLNPPLRQLANDTGTVVYLVVDFPTALSRIGDSPHRPLASANLQALFLKRLPHYRLSPVHIDAIHGTPDQIAERLAAILAAR